MYVTRVQRSFEPLSLRLLCASSALDKHESDPPYLIAVGTHSQVNFVWVWVAGKSCIDRQDGVWFTLLWSAPHMLLQYRQRSVHQHQVPAANITSTHAHKRVGNGAQDCRQDAPLVRNPRHWTVDATAHLATWKSRRPRMGANLLNREASQRATLWELA